MMKKYDVSVRLVHTKIIMKSGQKFEDLINKDKYQVFAFSCRAYFPFIFARHPWFVINENGVISRDMK